MINELSTVDLEDSHVLWGHHGRRSYLYLIGRCKFKDCGFFCRPLFTPFEFLVYRLLFYYHAADTCIMHMPSNKSDVDNSHSDLHVHTEKS